MGLLIDLFLIAILIINIMIGYKKGLINVILNICAFLIAIVLTLFLYKPIANIIITNTDIDDKIKEVIINNNIENQNSNIDEQDNKKEQTNQLQQYIENKIKETATQTREEAVEIVANTISNKSIEIITAIILFIIIRIIVIILQFLTDGIAKLPIIKQFNKAGGIIFGVIKAIIIIFIILTILFFVISINGNGLIADAINSSYITKILYDNNIIVNYCFLGKNLLLCR